MFTNKEQFRVYKEKCIISVNNNRIIIQMALFCNRVNGEGSIKCYFKYVNNFSIFFFILSHRLIYIFNNQLSKA